MSIDFNGTSSKLEHTTATGYNTDTMTILAWLWADGIGETNGYILTCDESTGAGTTSGFNYTHDTVANSLRLRYAFGTTDGIWTFPATDGQWNAVGMSYDRGSDTNDPVARVNFAPATVSNPTPPVGVAPSTLSGYCIGNVTNQTRTWNGAIQHLQFFNVILTAEEMDAALRRPGSIQRGLVSWWPMWDANYAIDLVNHSFQPTATSLVTRDGAPCQPPWAGAFGWPGAFTAGGVTPATTVFRRTLSPVGTRTGARQVHGWA